MATQCNKFICRCTRQPPIVRILLQGWLGQIGIFEFSDRVKQITKLDFVFISNGQNNWRAWKSRQTLLRAANDLAISNDKDSALYDILKNPCCKLLNATKAENGHHKLTVFFCTTCLTPNDMHPNSSLGLQTKQKHYKQWEIMMIGCLREFVV